MGDQVKTLEKKADQAVDRAENRADEALDRTGEKLHETADKVRQRADDTRLEGVAGKGARSLDRAGGYLEKKDVSELASNSADFIRRHPLKSAIVGLGLGVVLGKALGR